MLITIVDENGDAALDINITSVKISLQNQAGSFINSIDRTAISAVNSQTHTFSAANMLIEDETKKEELRILTVEATVLTVVCIQQIKFIVQNMVLIPHA